MNGALLDLLASKLSPGPLRLLVCHSNDAVLTGALHGLYRGVWWRVAGPEKPTAWPENGPYDEIILPLPRGKESLRLCLHGAVSVLKPNGVLWLAGANDLGIKSADKVLAEFFEVVEVAATGGHGRIMRASRLRAGAAQTLQQLRSSATMALPRGTVTMASYPGLFAGGQLDEGTNVLLQALADVPATYKTVLDYACGIGVIARAIQQIQPAATISMADHDPLALLAAAENVAGATVQLSSLPTDLTGHYDMVVSNPPIHQGDVQSFQVVDVLLGELPRLLAPAGQAVVVAQVTVPIARLASIHRLKCAELASSRSYRVWQLTR